MEEQNNQALWYVVHTYSGYEDKVARDLATMVENRHMKDLICEIKIPVEKVKELKTVKKKPAAKKKAAKMSEDYLMDEEPMTEAAGGEEQVEVEVEHKLFPGYVLVKMVMTDETWYVVRNTRGCTGFVGPEHNKPVPLSAEEVAALGVEKHTELKVDFKIGDYVQITAGPMEGFMGKVEEIDLAGSKVKLLVNMFGRETPAELELGQVELP